MKGRAIVDISGTDNDWNEIRNILITTCGQRNDSLIIAELSTATQGDLLVRDFFNLIRDMMMNLILAKTNGLTVQQAAAEEVNIKAMGLQRFIDGLHTDLSTYTAAKAPANLSDALKIALEREKSELKKQNTVVNDQLVTKQDMFDMLQKLVLKDDLQKIELECHATIVTIQIIWFVTVQIQNSNNKLKPRIKIKLVTGENFVLFITLHRMTTVNVGDLKKQTIRKNSASFMSFLVIQQTNVRQN